MRRALLALTLALAAAPALAQGYPDDGYGQSRYDTDGQSVDSIDVFFEPLARYGRWVDSRYGRAWSPNVARDWRPYTIGHWEDGPYGQTWRSDEPFGWAVYHFGRWGFDERIGWVWVPDTTWGPAWVAFRDSDDVTGWAPLPPRVSISFGFSSGYGGFNDWSYDRWYQPSWVYVPRGYLYGRSLRGAILPYGRNREFWNGTRGVTRYDNAGGRVVNRSFDRRDARDSRRDDRNPYRDQRDGNRGDRRYGGVPVQGQSSGFEQARRDRGDPRRVDAVPPALPPVTVAPGRGFGGRDIAREPGRERGAFDRGSRPDGGRPDFNRPGGGRGDGGARPPPVMVAPAEARAPMAAAPPPPRPQAAPQPAQQPHAPQNPPQNQQRERNSDERPQ